MSKTHTPTENTLNELLRGEIAATETYQQALSKVGDEPEAAEVHRMHREHREAANTLRQHVRDHAGEPDHGSGAWGALAKVVTSVAKLIGDQASLSALKRGEEYGIKQYREALNNAELPADCKNVIRSTLLPQTEEHVRTLERLMKTV